MTFKNDDEINPLHLPKDISDILSMLNVMDRHLEAMEFEKKYQNQYAHYQRKVKQKLPEPGADLVTKSNIAVKRKSVLQKINGRKVLTKAI